VGVTKKGYEENRGQILINITLILLLDKLNVRKIPIKNRINKLIE
jgi:hypothetical protein